MPDLSAAVKELRGLLEKSASEGMDTDALDALNDAAIYHLPSLLAAAEERDGLARALSKSVSAMSLALTGGGDKYAHAIRTAHDEARAALRAADTTAGGAE